MKAAQLMGPFNYVIKEVEKPKIGSDEVLIKVEATAICGSEYGLYYGISSVKPLYLHIQNWPMPPGAAGHEATGIVIEVGSNVKDVHVGDRVQGGINAYAEYAKAPLIGVEAGAFHPLLENLTFEEGTWAVLGSETRYVLMHTDIQKGDTVAIVGCGPAGLLILQHLKTIGVRDVICLDVVDYRLRMAEKFGAKSVINPVEEDVIKRVMVETQGNGVDMAIDTSGQTKTLHQEVKYVKRGGYIIIFGRPQSPLNDFILERVWDKNLVIRGCHSSVPSKGIRGGITAGDLRTETMRLIANREIDVKSMTTIYPLAEINRAFKDAAVKRKEGILKIILKP